MLVIKKILLLLVLSCFAVAGGLNGGKFYVGANLGISIPSVDAYSNDDGNIAQMTLGKSDIMYGINAGWRYFDKQVFHGIEVSVKDSNTKGTYKMGSLGGSFNINESYEISYKAGYALAEKTYVTGRLGYGVVKISHSIEGSSRIANEEIDHSINAIVAGLGLEYYIRDNISLGGEYIYRHDLEDINHRHMYLDNSGKYTDIKGDFSDHSFVLLINYFF